MEKTKWYHKYNNLLWILGFLAAAVLATVIPFDYYFDLNDDVYIKNITSGIYSGTPATHNIQMMYPISLVLGLMYRLLPNVVWYSIFIVTCNFGCLVLLLYTVLKSIKSNILKGFLGTLITVLFVGFLYYDLVFAQYTVTAALLVGTASFRFYLTDGELSYREFWKKNAGNIVMLVLAFCIRSEMMLLLLPMVAVMGLCKWSLQKPMFGKEECFKYFGTFGFILGGLLVVVITHSVAYSSKEWSEFMDLFDGRTQLYDYQTIPTYEGNEAFYDSISLEKEEVDLLISYNFALSDKIDGDTLMQIADYAGDLKAEQTSFRSMLGKAFTDYKYRTFHDTDFPWNLAVIVGYILVFFFATTGKAYGYLWKLLLLGAVRSALWMYICIGNRAPGRITHSLYFVEMCILVAFLWEIGKSGKKWLNGISVTALMLLGIVMLSINAGDAVKEYELKEAAAAEWDLAEEYCQENAENFYFFDLYSAVGYSEKLFDNWENKTANYDILGGWVVKSPHTAKKLSDVGISSALEGITEKENVYVIAKPRWGVDGINAYFASKGLEGKLTVCDEIKSGNETAFLVYCYE